LAAFWGLSRFFKGFARGRGVETPSERLSGTIAAPLGTADAAALRPNGWAHTGRLAVLGAVTGAIIAVVAAYVLEATGVTLRICDNPTVRSNVTALAELTDTELASLASLSRPSLPSNVPIERTIRVARGSTLMASLLEIGVDRDQVNQAVSALTTLFDPRSLTQGQRIDVTYLDLGRRERVLQSVAIPLSPTREIRAYRGVGEGFIPEQLSKTLERVLARYTGTIEDSFYLATKRAGMPDSVIMELIRMFSWDVDFQRDIQRGNGFEVLLEYFHDEEREPVKIGNVLFASLTTGGSTLRLYRHQLADGTVDYFNAQGESVRKALLRTPLDGARVSSTFGNRKHPILGFTTLHRGVDFAAPPGTPVNAAGDGVVEMASFNGNFGNYVQLRHNQRYKTGYAHLSSFAKGMKAGKRVRQGDIIGYVGSTGLSTGPHLHYEVLDSDRQVNPLSVKMATGQKLQGPSLNRFVAERAQIELRLASTPVATTRLAANLAR
jgi:murein DD-endopeptidase MepM/ murein hydrolase activator NlpD